MITTRDLFSYFLDYTYRPLRRELLYRWYGYVETAALRSAYVEEDKIRQSHDDIKEFHKQAARASIKCLTLGHKKTRRMAHKYF